MTPPSPRSRIGLATSPPEKLKDYFPSAAEPDLEDGNVAGTHFPPHTRPGQKQSP